MLDANAPEFHDVFFPVEIGPVCVRVGEGKGTEYIEVEGRQAVIETETKRVISVVSDQYQLVTNRQALGFAVECCKTAFGELYAEREWRLHAYAPPSGGWCRIDLEHVSGDLEFSTSPREAVPDVFGPFVRVVNSYDRSHALTIEIGFQRKVCKNGLVIPKSVVFFRFKHSTADLAERVKLEVERDGFRNLKQEFLGMLQPLRECEVPVYCFVPILFSALEIPKPKQGVRADWDAWERLVDDFRSLCFSYIDEMGATAYALLNCISEAATRPFRTVRKERHSLQRLAGKWLVDFSSRCKHAAFDIDEYVESLNGWSEFQNGSRNTGNWSRPANSGVPD